MRPEDECARRANVHEYESHATFRQDVEGWPGSGFNRKMTELRVRKVKPRGNKRQEVQIEIAIYTTKKSDRTFTELASFVLRDPELSMFIAAMQRKTV